jgi:hypothetical protein
MRLLIPVVGAVVGAAVGYLFERLPVRGVLQSVGAALVAWVISTVVPVLVWFAVQVRHNRLAAINVGLAEGPLYFLVVLLVLLALHGALGWAGGATHPILAIHRPLFLGLLGGLVGAFPYVWEAGLPSAPEA